ncbi:MAG: hypothetical protein VKJ04_01035 [Vampirovibrionales bacterium]|nr:hypothetical protein [Vampirovibrionales bacterium]
MESTEYWLVPQYIHERQRDILNRLLDGFEGNLTTSKWAKITQCFQDNVYLDILNLMERGILLKNAAGGRSTSYSMIKFES